jgi:peptidoglycan/xylan/chitin deacetylase (PgdA/CDA1 family)
MFIITLTRRQVLRRTIYLFGLALLIAFTSWAGSRAHFAWVPGADQPLTRADSPDNRLALTFDVTWGEKELTAIRGVLAGSGVKATFFVGGTFLGNHPTAVRQLAAEGHEIGTLGQKIIDLSALPENEVTSNLLASQSALAKMLGGPVRYFRPPQGPATPSVVTAARAANLITVTSSLDAEDYKGLKAEQIADRVLKSAQKGDIVLLSASDWSPETTKALPAIIKGLQERGFKLVRVSELVPQEDLR